MVKILLGICAMEKKVNSKHMQNILLEFSKFPEFEIVFFSHNIIFNEEVENWPVVQALIIFFSNGFPYSKGLQYVNLRKPFLINDFENQKVFWDRRQVFKLLANHGVPTPNNFVIDRGDEINNDYENKSSQKLKDSEEEIRQMIEIYNKPYDSNIYKNPEEKLASYNPNSTFNSTTDLSNKYKKEEHDIYEKLYEELETKPFIEEKEKKLIKQNENSNTSVGRRPEEDIVHIDAFGNKIIEYEDHLEKIKLDGGIIKIWKPFVEKPCNGDDHRIFIYYPPILGGGLKRLFRKTKNMSSLYIPNQNNIRNDKSYIYEEFLQTDGFDIKVYTVGPEYAHAEARKSPSLDGVVRRTMDGKEVRYPINLTPYEKGIAKKIVEIFKQNVCGFDILRSKGKSYVCDVNGWSFVKSNKKYYADCSILLRKMILTALAPKLYDKLPMSLFTENIPKYEKLVLPTHPCKKAKNSEADNPAEEIQEELRSVVCVFRHGDRSPKQKMKVAVVEKRILDLFKIYGETRLKNYIDQDNKELYLKVINGEAESEELCDELIKKLKEVKLKKPKELNHMLSIAKILVEEKETSLPPIDKNKNFLDKMLQLKMILETNTNFMGMTRKVQLKPLKITINLEAQDPEITVIEALFVFKWGGDLTHSGIRQARLLGNTFRLQVYPQNSNQEEDGLLRLHSTYRHDLKVYSSDEGRCMKSGAAFLQGLLQLDGSIIPIIFSMIRKDDPVLDILDDSNREVSKLKKQFKKDLSEMLHYNGTLSNKFKEFILKNEYSGGESVKTIKKKKSENKLGEEYDLTTKSKMEINEVVDKTRKESPKYLKSEQEVQIMSRDSSLGSLNANEIGLNYDKYLFKLMERIDNPIIELRNVYELMGSLINTIKSLLPEEELGDTNTYMINKINNLLKRKASDAENFRVPVSKDHYFKKDSKSKSRHSHSVRSLRESSKNFNSSTENAKTMNISTIKKEDDDLKSEAKIKSTKDPNQDQIGKQKQKMDEREQEITECETEKLILIYKRWIKLFQDFFDLKKKKFDISKIADIYDNIKYDLIHNKFLENEFTNALYEKSMYLAEFLMPQEYGITLSQKIKIGMMIISPLLNKIRNDLLWWLNKTDNLIGGFEKENETFLGLDRNKLNNEIKSAWRHLKTRFYFTSASHLYSLINVICYGLDSNLLEKNEEAFISELKKNRLEVDYCSHLMFRLYENLNAKEEDPERFRLEVIMSPGANKPPYEADENHMIGVSPWIILNKNLTLKQMTEFFDGLKQSVA